MLTGELTSNSPDSDDASCDGIFNGLSREEILGVLSEGICQHCCSRLKIRILTLLDKKFSETSLLNDDTENLNKTRRSQESRSPASFQSQEFLHSVRQNSYAATALSASVNGRRQALARPDSVSVNGRRQALARPGSVSVNGRRQALARPDSDLFLLNDGLCGDSWEGDDGMSEEQQQVRFSQVGRKKDFVYLERIDGRPKNVIQGLELYTKVFNAEEQKRIVEYVYSLQRMGQKGQLRERTYSEPRKWMRGKGRVTIQFGCCYNYAVDKNGNPPGILRDEDVDPLPPLFKQMIKRMVRWHVLPPTCIPNSCIVNIYDEGDCIPPHIDHHDFVRPFCTVSFLTECNILFGSNLKILSPGEFSGPVSVPLPVGSVLILSGNGADVAKHCVPAVPAKRISITFRKMDNSRIPYTFSPDPELVGIKPMVYSPLKKSSIQQNGHHEVRAYSPPSSSSSYQQNGELPVDERRSYRKRTNSNSFIIENDDFPPLSGGSSSSSSRNRNQVRGSGRRWNQ